MSLIKQDVFFTNQYFLIAINFVYEDKIISGLIAYIQRSSKLELLRDDGHPIFRKHQLEHSSCTDLCILNIFHVFNKI